MNKTIYPLDSREAYFTKKEYKALSLLWNSFERTFLSIFVEEIFKLNLDFICISVCLEHDGILVFSECPVPDQTLQTIEIKITELIEEVSSRVPIFVF